MALADQDESVRIAVRALGDMRNSAHATSPTTSFQPTPALSITSGTSSPSLPSPSLLEDDLRAEDDEDGVRRGRLGAFASSSAVAAGAGGAAAAEGSEEWKSLSRVSNIPLVNSALRAYEQSKASSRVVKYGAEMMESSVKSISRPVFDRLPVGQLDDFACRQLDRVPGHLVRCECLAVRTLRGYGARGSELARGDVRSMKCAPVTRAGPKYATPRLGHYARGSSTSRSRNESPDPRRPWETATRDVSMSRADSDRSVPQLSPLSTRGDDDMRGDSGRGPSQSRTPTPHSSTSSQPEKPTLPPASTLTQHADAQESQQVAQRSRWQAMILEAGGLSAAISEESMRRLKYCLQWLQYATAQIDAQILVLRNFIASLQQNGASAHVSAQHLRTLQAAKRDVVDTIRQVVEVVSRYAGGALPEPARTRVRSFILCLPRRWAAASTTGDGPPSAASASLGHGPVHEVRGESTGVGSASSRGRHRATAPYSYGPGEAGPAPRSRPASRATSPTRGTTRALAHGHGHSRQSSGGGSGAGTSADSATQAAQKILTLATESLDMLRSVTSVFRDSLERADIWVERLRVVGLQRQQNPDVDPENDPMLNFREPLHHLPPLRSHTHSPVTSTAPHSPYASAAPLTSAPGSGYTTPYLPPPPALPPLPRSASSSSVASLNLGLAFPGPLNVHGAYDGVGFDKLSLGSAASSRFATPKSVLLGLPPEAAAAAEGDGMEGRRRSESDESEAAVVAATALAGMAGAGAGGAANGGMMRVKQEEREVGMDVDG
ncbi:transcription factor Opi1-domain-containing protein [Lenzites betulinus]|nr:transcription factor Opi1-domain-containing protein [Lenzites betulinus]